MMRRLSAVLLAVCLSGFTFATQRACAQDMLVTNLADLAEQAFSGGHSFYIPFSPWEWHAYSLDGGLPYWVDCSALPCSDLLPASGSLRGVALFSGVLTKNVLTGETLLQSEWSTNVIGQIPAPSGYQPGALAEDRYVWWLWQQWTNYPDSWGVPDEGIVAPTVTLKVLLADAQDKPDYDAAIAAEDAAWAEAEQEAMATASRFTTMTEDEGEMMLMDSVSCSITDEASPFTIIDIHQDANRFTTITFESCSDHAYLVASTDALTTNTIWTYRVSMVPGQDGTTSWTDAGTTNITVRFYRVHRLWLGDTVGDGIPDWWRQFYFGTATTTNSSSCAACDPDGDFFSNLSEFLAGTSPLDPSQRSMYGFVVNGGDVAASNAQVRLDFPAGFVSDFIIISESSTMSNSVTNSFSVPMTYTLADTNDGVHTLYAKLLYSGGTTSAVFDWSFELDTHQPTISISSPTDGTVTALRRISLTGFAADVAVANTLQLDTNRWLQVTVNGDFVNDRDSNGVWSSGLHDLTPGTNTFVAVATDRVGLTATNAIWLIYDSTLATNAPILTVDNGDDRIFGGTTTSFALGGSIDDGNATVQIDLLDAGDNSITNATVSAAVQGTNWWATIPVISGTNLVQVTAQNSGSLPTNQSFTIIQDTNIFLEITSPLPDETINATNVIVSGIASLSLSNWTITINGQTASKTVGSNSVAFTSTSPVPLDETRNLLKVQADPPSGGFSISSSDPTFTTEQREYRYELLAVHLGYADDHVSSYIDHTDFALDWDGPPGNTYHAVWASPPYYGYHTGAIYFDCGLPPGHVCIDLSEPDYWGDWPPRPSIGDFAFHYSSDSWLSTDNDYLIAIKHAPVDEEQEVIFWFDGLGRYRYYEGDRDFAKELDFDPATIKFRGSPGFWDVDENGQTNGVAFLVKIRTNTPFKIQQSDFVFPAVPEFGKYAYGYSHDLYFKGFGNDNVTVKLTAYRPQTPPFDPLKPYAVPDDQKADPGAGIRVNGENSETNLIQVTLQVGTAPAPSSVKYFLKRSNNKLKVWTSKTKDTAILDTQDEQELSLNNATRTGWVENVTSGIADLELQVRKADDNSVLNSDKVHFYSFTSIVIALGGRTQVPHDPVTPALPDPDHPGTFDIARDLYLAGYDVHMYNEADVGTNVTSSVPYLEVQSATQNRDVSNIAIFGYSYGGGATYNLAAALGRTLAFTAYIDAVINPFFGNPCSSSSPPAQTNWPIGSTYHVNYFQFPHTLLDDECLGGSNCTPVASYEFNLDPLVTHFTIDDNGGVRNGIEQKLKANVPR
jgi:hypothetical protein